MDGFNDMTGDIKRAAIITGLDDLSLKMSQETWYTYLNEIFMGFMSPYTQEEWNAFYRARGITPPPSNLVAATYHPGRGDEM